MEATVGRVLLASLHQAIAEVLPRRLDAYERWLAPSSERDALPVGDFAAMLASLNQEPDGWDPVMACGGRHAGARLFRQVPAVRRAGLRLLPRRLRAAKVMRLLVGMLPALYPGTQVDVTRRGSTVLVNIDGSPFCAAAPNIERPACRFYAEATTAFLQRFSLLAAVKVSRCRAAGSKSCLLMVLPNHESVLPAPVIPLAPATSAPSLDDREAIEARWDRL